MGILDQAGSQTVSGSSVVKSELEPENDSVLFEDTWSLEALVPGTDSEDTITFPTMPAELENYGAEIDPQVSIILFTRPDGTDIPFNHLSFPLKDFFIELREKYTF